MLMAPVREQPGWEDQGEFQRTQRLNDMTAALVAVADQLRRDTFIAGYEAAFGELGVSVHYDRAEKIWQQWKAEEIDV